MALIAPELVRLWIAANAMTRDVKRVTLVTTSRGNEGEVHTTPNLVVCLAGVVRIERSGLRPLDLAAGEAALITPGVYHTHAPLKAGCAGYSQGFMLGRSDIELALADRLWIVAVPELPSRILLDRACQHNGDERTRLTTVRKVLEALAASGAQPMEPMSDSVERMWSFLRKRRLSPINAADVLRASGLGPTRAHLLFTAYFNETPHQLLTKYRLEYARHLLALGEGVAAVATASGFRTRRHFTAAFRAAHGASPRNWLATQDSLRLGNTPNRKRRR